MVPIYDVTRDDLIRIFTQWEQDAQEGNWADNPFDAEASADYFIEVLERD